MSNSSRISLLDQVKIAILLTILLGFMGYIFIMLPSSRPKPPETNKVTFLYSQLPDDGASANAAFRDRVFAKFPLLTSEATLVRELSSEGFVSDGWLSKRMTFRSASGIKSACSFTATVSWETDQQSRIRSIDARFLKTAGCVGFGVRGPGRG